MSEVTEENTPVQNTTATAATAATAATPSPLNFRPPPAIVSNSPGYTPTTTEWMAGVWYVTHSTLPMWKSNRNVKITYNHHETISDAFDNLVEYNPLGSDKYKSVAGVEKPDADIPNAWNWRGKGWLMIASSHWEVLGWGEEDGGWMVTFFQKTLFTPAGIDICVRRREGISQHTYDQICSSLRDGKDNSTLTQLVESMFKVKHD